jgi:tape measure domain-containing protein
MSSGVEYLLRARDMLSGTLKNAVKQAQAMQGSVNNVNKSFDNAGKAAGKFAGTASGSTSQITGKIQRLNDHLIDLKNRQIRAFDDKTIAKYNTYIRKTQTELRRLNDLPPRSMISRFREANTSAGNLTSQITRVVGVLALLRGAGGILKMGMDLEMTNVSFEVLLGNAERARKMITGINDFAAKTPFEQRGLMDAAKMMLSFNIAQEKIMPNLKMIGDIAMGDANKMNSLTLAYSQMSSAGKLMGQDLLQMINAGFNPLQEIARTTGKSMAVLKKEMSEGKIPVEMVEAAFRSATMEGGKFFGMMEKMSQKAGGKLSTVLGTLKQTGAEIGLKLLPYISSLLDYMMPLAGWISRNADMIIQLTAVALGAVVAFKTVTGAIQLWTIAQAILNGTMMLNPIGLIVAGIAALVAGIIIAYHKLDWFRGIVIGTWDTMKLFVNFLKDAVMNTVYGLVDVFSGLGKIIASIFAADWEGVKSGAMQAGKGFLMASPLGVMKAAYDNGTKVGETFSKGYKRGVDSMASKTDSEAENKTTDDVSTVKPDNSNIDPTESLQSITSGGAKQTHININLNKEMIGQITINPTTMQEGISDLKDRVMEAMAQILNSANRIALD